MICVSEFCSAEWAGEGEAEYKETAQLGGECRHLSEIERQAMVTPCFNFYLLLRLSSFLIS